MHLYHIAVLNNEYERSKYSLRLVYFFSFVIKTVFLNPQTLNCHLGNLILTWI